MTTGRAAVAVVLAVAVAAAPGRAADLRLEGLLPAGGRTTATDAPGVLRFTLTNPNPDARDARVLVYYAARPDVQYGRDVWVPGNAQITAWVPVGPPPPAAAQFGREVRFLLADRTGGETRVLTPAAEQMRNRAIPYKKREPSTAVLTDEFVTDTPDPDVLDRKASAAARAVELARAFRAARGLSETVTAVIDRLLPPTPGALAGIDQFVLAGNRLAADPLGARTLREWVQGGGALWVLLDRVEPATVAAVLGDDLGFGVADRTSVTTVRLAGRDGRAEPARSFDHPVAFVRVVPAAADTVLVEADGWPAAFARPLGRGKVVFTTLGERAWHRPRLAPRARNRPGDEPSPYPDYPDLPVPLPPLERVALELYPEGEAETFRPDGLAPLVTAEVGYQVIGREAAAVILGGCVLGAAGVAAGLRGGRRPELAGWVGPAAAVGAAGLLVVLGTESRQAVPPTAAWAAIVDVAPGAGEGAAAGLFAVYRPDSGEVRLGSVRGGEVDLDTAGVENQTRRRIQTDIGVWHWEDFALPAGLRVGPFRATVPTGEVAATARFGPDGVSGRLDRGSFTHPSVPLDDAPFSHPADAVIRTPAGEPVGVRLAEDGAFTAGEVLPPGQYLTGGVLSDLQQRRQEVYRKLLARPVARRLDGRDLLFVWGRPYEPPFTAGERARTVGHYLLVVPLAFERTPPDTPVTVPRGFIPAWTTDPARPLRLPVEGTEPQNLRLRFVLPPAVVPMTVERATLTLRVRAPVRPVTVSANGVLLREVESPAEPVRVEVTDPTALRPDAGGGLAFTVAVGGRTDADGRPADVRLVNPDDQWRIEAVGLEVGGRTAR
jgi:hypothetical protein